MSKKTTSTDSTANTDVSSDSGESTTTASASATVTTTATTTALDTAVAEIRSRLSEFSDEEEYCRAIQMSGLYYTCSWQVALKLIGTYRMNVYEVVHQKNYPESIVWPERPDMGFIDKVMPKL